jgi:hypothetical protein
MPMPAITRIAGIRPMRVGKGANSQSADRSATVHIKTISMMRQKARVRAPAHGAVTILVSGLALNAALTLPAGEWTFAIAEHKGGVAWLGQAKSVT